MTENILYQGYIRDEPKKTKTELAISAWRAEHLELITDEWWLQLFDDFGDKEDLLEYLESLCRHCLSETEGKKGRKFCPKCKTMIKGEYK